MCTARQRGCCHARDGRKNLNGRMNLSQLFGRKGGEVQFGFFIESPSLDKGRAAKVLGIARDRQAARSYFSLS